MCRQTCWRKRRFLWERKSPYWWRTVRCSLSQRPKTFWSYRWSYVVCSTSWASVRCPSSFRTSAACRKEISGWKKKSIFTPTPQPKLVPGTSWHFGGRAIRPTRNVPATSRSTFAPILMVLTWMIRCCSPFWISGGISESISSLPIPCRSLATMDASA
ncbi:hypothetical protein PKCEKB_PKCEKB_15300, partial [Dysosmobacter welbionis]